MVPVLHASMPTTTTTTTKEDKAPAAAGGAVGEHERALDVFQGTVPVPMVVPGRKYEGSDLKPWYFLE